MHTGFLFCHGYIVGLYACHVVELHIFFRVTLIVFISRLIVKAQYWELNCEGADKIVRRSTKNKQQCNSDINPFVRRTK